MQSRLIITSITIVFSVIFFSLFVMVYIPIFKENIRSGTVQSQRIISIGDDANKNVLGEEDPVNSESKNPNELRMKSAALREESTSSPQDTPVLFGVAVNDYSNETNELSQLLETLGGKISSVSVYKQFGLEGNSSFSPEDFSYVKSNNMKLVIAWEPWNPTESMNQATDFLKEIILGLQDNYIRSFALSIKKYENPVVIRFAHEMNGNWYPWGNRPTEYIEAYRHIVSIFRNESVSNVQWMWCINAESVPVVSIENVKNFYPGDDVVDVIGIDGINFGTSQKESQWRSFEEVFQRAYSFLQQNYSKPIVIAETASSEVGGSKAAWVRGMFTSLSLSFPEVTEIIWFNFDKETDWRINSSDSSLKVFKEYL